MEFRLLENTPLTSAVWRMRLGGDTAGITRPGQFADVHIDGHFLRRPFSVCDWDKDVLVLVYRLIGQGTRDLAEKQPGEGLDILTGLGNGFDTSLSGDHPLRVAGGAPQHVLWRLENGELEGYSARRFVVRAGAHNSPFDQPPGGVENGLRKIRAVIAARHPTAEIVVESSWKKRK